MRFFNATFAVSIFEANTYSAIDRVLVCHDCVHFHFICADLGSGEERVKMKSSEYYTGKADMNHASMVLTTVRVEVAFTFL